MILTEKNLFIFNLIIVAFIAPATILNIKAILRKPPQLPSIIIGDGVSASWDEDTKTFTFEVKKSEESVPQSVSLTDIYGVTHCFRADNLKDVVQCDPCGGYANLSLVSFVESPPDWTFITVPKSADEIWDMVQYALEHPLETKTYMIGESIGWKDVNVLWWNQGETDERFHQYPNPSAYESYDHNQATNSYKPH